MESFFSLFRNFLFIKTYGFESFNLIFGPFYFRVSVPDDDDFLNNVINQKRIYSNVSYLNLWFAFNILDFSCVCAQNYFFNGF